VRMAAELYERVGAQAPLTGKVKELYERAAKTAGDLDMSAIATVYVGEPAASN
jgi:3-hydroxyisobutyrate dehydrogenase-like beta-hydroxyacid dehydrogenase